MNNETNKEAVEKKRPGRKPMTPEEKAAATAARAEERDKANNLRPEIFVQYQGEQTSMNALAEAVKADFHAAKKRTLVTDLKLYVKPEEHVAYYVINGKFEGKVSFENN